MGLSVYQLDETNHVYAGLSTGTFFEPVILSPRPGGSAKVKKLFLRNDDATKWYSDIVITPKTTTGEAIEGSSLLFKLLSGSAKPSAADWEAAEPNDDATLTSPMEGGPRNTRLPEIGAPGTPDLKYYPFWVWVDAGASLPIDNDVFSSLRVSYTENVA